MIFIFVLKWCRLNFGYWYTYKGNRAEVFSPGMPWNLLLCANGSPVCTCEYVVSGVWAVADINPSSHKPALVGGTLFLCQIKQIHCWRWSKLFWFDITPKRSRQSHFCQRRPPKTSALLPPAAHLQPRSLSCSMPCRQEQAQGRGFSHSLSKYPQTRLRCKLKVVFRWTLTCPLSNSQTNIRQKTLCNIHNEPSFAQALRLPIFTAMIIMITKMVTKKVIENTFKKKKLTPVR